MSLATDNPSTSSSSSQWLQSFSRIEFSEIMTATKNFDESLVIGSGGFGKVYKANITTKARRVRAAIKRLDPNPDSSQGSKEFWAEVKTLSKLSHWNIMPLIGYCIHEQEKILVYEYMPNGSLEDHLYKHRTPLSWLQRLNICIGAGHGLRYLHNVEIDSGIIHADFKSSNILLTNGWTAKVSGFGFSETCPTNRSLTHVKTVGTYGYFDPCYYVTGRLTRKSDVFAFGVVMLEVLCRKPAVDRSLPEWRSLVVWVRDSLKEGNLEHIVDSDILHEISLKCLKTFISIAERCLDDNSKGRPTMAKVVFGLESVLALQEKSNTTLHSTALGVPNLSSNSNNNDIIASNVVRAKDGVVPPLSQNPSPSLKNFRFDDLEESTRGFSPDLLLGKGGTGEVFLGWFDETTLATSIHGDGIAVAVKRLDHESIQGHGYNEWLTEVNILGHMDHPNIIRLLGYCRDGQEHLLVYEYMPNNSLYRLLHEDDITEPLSWGTRLLIMIRVIRGLIYLHSRNIILRGLKSKNILMDEDLSPRLGGFALAKYGPETWETHVNTLIKGTYGYLDPDYYQTGQLTIKTDIYSFGVVLLESITGRKAIDYSRRPDDEDMGLVRWATKMKSKRRNVKEIMDPRLELNYPLQGASKCFALALNCIEEIPNDRPSSEEVLQSLEQLYALRHG